MQSDNKVFATSFLEIPEAAKRLWYSETPLTWAPMGRSSNGHASGVVVIANFALKRLSNFALY